MNLKFNNFFLSGIRVAIFLFLLLNFSKREALAINYGCFPAETGVRMASGEDKPIREVLSGDRVLSRDEDGMISESKVLNLIEREKNNMCRISFSHGGTLKLTQGHPIYTSDGWKAVEPADLENTDMRGFVSKLLLGDSVVSIGNTVDEVESISCWSEYSKVYTLELEKGAHTFFAEGHMVHNWSTGDTGCGCCGGTDCDSCYSLTCGGWGWTCFAAGTKVITDKGEVNIEDVKVGEKVVSQSENGERLISRVTRLDQPIREHMCRLDFSNGGIVKLTEEHPLMTQDGWKALDPNKTKNENPSLKVGKLEKGDIVVREDGVKAELENISCWSERVQAYNLILDGSSHSYFANGYLAHNKGGGGGCTPNCPANYCGPDSCGGFCDSPTDPGAPSNLLVSQANAEATLGNITWIPGNWGAKQLIRVGENEAEVNSGCYGTYTPACIASYTFPTYTQPADPPAPGIDMYYFDKLSNKCEKTGPNPYLSISSCETNLGLWVKYPDGSPRTTGICYVSEVACNSYNQHSYVVNNFESGKKYWIRVVNWKSDTCIAGAVTDFNPVCPGTGPATPSQLSPGNGGSSVTQSVTFSWNPVSDWGIECWGANRGYSMCVGPNAADPCSGGSTYSTSDTTSPATSYPVSLPIGTSYWKVRATNKLPLNSSYSPVWNVCVEGFNAGAGGTGSPYLSDWGACDASTHKRTRTCTEDCGTDNCTAAAAAGLLSEDCLGVVSGTLFDASDLSGCPSPIPPELIIPNANFGFSDLGAGGTHPWSPLTSPVSTNASGNYSLNVYAPTTYAYDFSALGNNFVVSSGPKFNCAGATAGVAGSLSSCLTQPCTTLSGMNFGFWRSYGGWWQAVGGNVYGDDGIKSEIPSSIPPTEEMSLILPDGNRRGFLSYGVPRPANIFGTNLLAKASASLWEKESKYGGQVYDWSYYNTRFNLFTKTAWAEGQPIVYTPTSGNYQIFKTDDSVTAFNYSPEPNQFVIFHVNGDVKITSNISVPVGSFLAVIAKGTITFDTNVTSADGWYVGNNIAVPCTDLGSDGCDKTDVQFLGNGSFIGWNGFALGRMTPTNNTTPSEKFRYRQDLFVNAPIPMRFFTRYFKPFVP